MSTVKATYIAIIHSKGNKGKSSHTLVQYIAQIYMEKQYTDEVLIFTDWCCGLHSST